MILIHSTHEAGLKFGGIGAVLDGLLAAPSYRERVDRTLVVGPLNTRDGTEIDVRRATACGCATFQSGA